MKDDSPVRWTLKLHRGYDYHSGIIQRIPELSASLLTAGNFLHIYDEDTLWLTHLWCWSLFLGCFRVWHNLRCTNIHFSFGKAILCSGRFISCTRLCGYCEQNSIFWTNWIWMTIFTLANADWRGLQGPVSILVVGLSVSKTYGVNYQYFTDFDEIHWNLISMINIKWRWSRHHLVSGIITYFAEFCALGHLLVLLNVVVFNHLD